MSLVEWNGSLLIGIDEFDKHHKHLVGLLNTSFDSFVRTDRDQEVGKVLAELLDYATYHFNAEEAAMRESGYPEMDRHLQEHERFIRRVLEIHDDACRDRSVAMELLQFLNNWLKNHILNTDSAFAAFLKSAAAKGFNLDLAS